MLEAPKFVIHEFPNYQDIYVELDPQDGSNFQAHEVIRLKYDATAQTYQLWRKVEQDMAISATTKEEAIKRACSELAKIWAGV